MKQTKYIPSMGLAFAEEREMKKLSKYAEQGWLLEDFALFGYRLKKDEAAEVIYALDSNSNPDEDYFSYFAASGWKHVCSSGGILHIFQAPSGTEPIYTDLETEMEKYERDSGMVAKTALISLLMAMFFFFLTVWIGKLNLPAMIEVASLALGALSLVVLVFSGMPYVAYQLKLLRMRK